MSATTSTEPAPEAPSSRSESSEDDNGSAGAEADGKALPNETRQDEKSSESEESEGEIPSSSASASEISGRRRNQEEEDTTDIPPLPNEPLPDSGAPPLPSEPEPASAQADDGWQPHWNPSTSSWWFYNRFTGVWQQENPRVPIGNHAAPVSTVITADTIDATSGNAVSVAGGYNPAIHGSYDENAWYAQGARAAQEAAGDDAQQYAVGAFFNKHTGRWQAADMGPDRHSDEAKSKRQMQAFFDVDAAANMHDGRSLKAERSGKKPSKAELKAFKEKRRAKKAEKRRAWLRD